MGCLPHSGFEAVASDDAPTEPALMSDVKMGFLYVRHTWPIYLTKVDPEANSIIFMPISAMVMVIAVVMIRTILVPIVILVLIAIMGPGRIDSSQHETGKESSHYQQYSAVMPRHYIFHSS
jgi:hypothetical protein